MVYVVTEDSNSARYFWKIVFDTFHKGRYELLTLPTDKFGVVHGGNTTLDKQIQILTGKLLPGDKVYVAFDSVVESKSFSTFKFLSRLQRISAELKVDVAVTTYYCFEELYLSYIEIITQYESLASYNDVVLKALKFVHNKLMADENYFNTDEDCIRDFISTYKRDSGANREHFANALLLVVTKSLSNWFHISKHGNCCDMSGAGRCFLLGCKDIQSTMNEKHIEHQCSICKYTCRNMSTVEKLLDLEQKSICQFTGLKLSGV